MGKWKMVVIVIIALMVLSLAKDLVIKTAVEKGVEVVTGLRLTTSGLSVGILRSAVSIKNLKLYNPKGFSDPTMIDMPEIYVRYDLPAIIGGTTHLNEVRIDLAELVVVKNSEGKLNLDSLKAISEQKKGERPSDKRGEPMKLRIDVLKLKLGKAVYKDYSSGGAPSVKEFNLGLNETFTNIDNPNTLVSLIVVKVLLNTSIGSLANFDVGSLSSSVSGSLASAKQAVAKAQADMAKAVDDAKSVAEGAKASFATAGAAAKDATESAKKTAESLGGLFKGFGSSKE